MKEQFPEEYKELNISHIRQIPSDTEIPIHNNTSSTQRPLCANFPENKNLVNQIEAIVLSDENLHDDLFTGEYSKIKSLEDLKKILSEVLIRFDTDPDHYTKEDYAVLMRLLYSALLYLYGQIEEFKPPIISVNEQQIEPTEENEFKLSIGTDDQDHLEVETSNGKVNIKTKVGEMETPSNNLATINDIRNYIENRLEWQVVNQ